MAKAKMVKTEDEILPSFYLDPLTDFGFKKIFLNKELLIAFLNDLLCVHIKDIQYQPTEGLGDRAEYRRVIFDLFCTTESGEYFIVEMQVGRQTFFADRALFYASHAIRKQAPRKKYWNYELKAVYVVAILDFITFKEESVKNTVIEQVYLYREHGGKQFSDKLNLIFIELPKFTKQANELQTNTDKWLYLLKHLSTLESPPYIEGNIFKRFLEVAQVRNLTPTEMETYTRTLKRDYGVRDIVSYAKRETRDEERIQFAVKLLKRKTPVAEIVELTELTTAQIQDMLKNLQ
ncbi:MAG: Rpn family recombination-promoting nuclease/putative transposase [Bacteroidales bacterium]|jgi:predicted transposase/invertase (TIGR01784 family)|nr:Rpn family recombination-promoting nuclease/putative transposase [Bacteroidales bacterium]